MPDKAHTDTELFDITAKNKIKTKIERKYNF